MVDERDDEPDFGVDAPGVEIAKHVTKRSVQAAVNMAISGAPYDEIARVLNYTSAAAARAAVERGLADAYEAKDTTSLRRITSARIEGLWRITWEKAQKDTITRWSGPSDDRVAEEVANPEQLAYIRLGMDLTARWAKLHGLDAPTQVQVSPNAEEFAQVVRALAEANQEGLPMEADIFADEEVLDAEVEEPTDG